MLWTQCDPCHQIPGHSTRAFSHGIQMRLIHNQYRCIMYSHTEVCAELVDLYSSTCHGRPPLVQRKSGPSWQVAPRDRERTYAPLCQIKQTHQTAYISQHMHNIMKHSGQLQCCIGLQWEMKRTMLKMCEKINSIYPQCNAYFKICRSNRRRFEMSHGNWPL